MKYFKMMKSNIDVKPLLEEISSVPKIWSMNTSRQDRFAVQRETHSLVLRGRPPRKNQDKRKDKDVHESRDTQRARHFPKLMKFMENFAVDQDAELGRARLVRLVSGKRVYPHVDKGEYYRLRNRYHLVIQSQLGSPLISGGEEVRMGEGELWWFDNKQIHEAYNNGDADRIHVIFDMLPRSSASEIIQEKAVGQSEVNKADSEALVALNASPIVAGTSISTTDRKVVLVPGKTSGRAIGRRQAFIVIDHASGETILASNSAMLFHPAGLVKLLLLYDAFDAVSNTVFSLSTRISIPSTTNDKLGSKIFRVGETITVEQAIRAVVQRQSNLAAVALANARYDDEKSCASHLTERASQLGMNGTRILNVTGLHDPKQVSTPRDLALLCHVLIRDFPEFFGYFGEPGFAHKKHVYTNRNLLVGICKGVDGLFTARNRAAGHHVAATAEREGRRLIALATGAESAWTASDKAVNLLAEAYGKNTNGRQGLAVAI